jgi:hypothetical protein
MAPKGEKLAYINDKEAKLLKKMGGAGIDVNGTGIKSYVNFGSGRGSVAESLNQAAFGSSGPTFSSDGGGGSFTPKGNFATITKDKGDIPKGSGALTAGSLFSKYFKNFQYATPPGISIDKLRNLAIKTASNNSITDLLKGVLTDPDKFDPDFKRGSQIKASYPQYVKEGILSALGFKPTSQIGGGTNAGRALLEKIGSIPGAKTVGRALPGIGTVSGIYDVGSRLSQGDYFGAGLGALSAVPFAGIPAAAAQAAYDYSRAKYARGGNTGYSDFASPSSSTASQDFSTQAVSGGQTDYGGGGDGNDQPITEIRPNFNYNIDRSLIDPRLNFKNIEAIIYLQEFLDKQAKGEDADLEADINYNAPFLESGLASLAYNTNRGFTAGLSGNLTPNLRGGVSFQDGQQNLNLNYNKGPFSAGIASGPQGYDARFGVNYEFAKGGRINYARGGNTGYSDFASPSSTTASQDFSTQAVSGGSDGGSYDYIPQPTVAKIATQLLNEMAPKGEKLAYINNKEAKLLKRMGGAGIDVNGTGIKSYVNFGSGRGSVAESLNQAAFGSSGPTFSSDGGGGSYDYIPQPTVAELNKINTPGDGTYVNPNKTVIETLRDSNFLSNFQRKGIDRALANQWAREVQRLAPYVIGDMDKDYYFGDLKTAADLGLKNAPTTLPGGKTDIPGTAEYLAFNTIGLPALGLQSLTNLLDKALAPPATLEGALATRDKMQGIYDDIGRIGQLGFEDKYMNNPPPTIDGGDSQPIRLPIIAEAPSDVESTPSDFDLYAALEGREAMRFGQKPYGYTGAMQRFAEGGEVRQAYGLGSLVRKATKAVKKVLKSDIGKAALLYGAGTYLGGTKFMSGDGTLSFMDRLKNPALLKNLVYTDNKFSPFKGIAAATALTGLFSKNEEEDEDLDQISSRKDESGLKELIATYKPLRFQVKPEYQLAANGGRMGYEEGGNINPADLPMSREGLPTYEDIETGEEVDYPYKNKERSSAPDIDAELFQMYLDAIGSGKIPRSTTFDQYKELMGEKASMSPERTMANEGGLMNLGGNEMDLRGGGFVPLGAKEKADDVPARLSKNEFVFTADAVRAAGGGDVDRGANLMYKTMKNLESRVG